MTANVDEFTIGELVDIHGLKDTLIGAQLNGARAVVVGKTSERVRVNYAYGGKNTNAYVKSLKPTNLKQVVNQEDPDLKSMSEPVGRGDVVIVYGLKHEKVQHMNELRGQVISDINEDSGRFQVVVPELNEIKLVKPANLMKTPKFLAPKINLKSFAAEATAEYIFHNMNSDWIWTTRNNRVYPFVVDTISKVKEGKFTVELGKNYTLDESENIFYTLEFKGVFVVGAPPCRIFKLFEALNPMNISIIPENASSDEVRNILVNGHENIKFGQENTKFEAFKIFPDLPPDFLMRNSIKKRGSKKVLEQEESTHLPFFEVKNCKKYSYDATQYTSRPKVGYTECCDITFDEDKTVDKEIYTKNLRVYSQIATHSKCTEITYFFLGLYEQIDNAFEYEGNLVYDVCISNGFVKHKYSWTRYLNRESPKVDNQKHSYFWLRGAKLELPDTWNGIKQNDNRMHSWISFSAAGKRYVLDLAGPQYDIFGETVKIPGKEFPPVFLNFSQYENESPGTTNGDINVKGNEVTENSKNKVFENDTYREHHTIKMNEYPLSILKWTYEKKNIIHIAPRILSTLLLRFLEFKTPYSIKELGAPFITTASDRFHGGKNTIDNKLKGFDVLDALKTAFLTKVGETGPVELTDFYPKFVQSENCELRVKIEKLAGRTLKQEMDRTENYYKDVNEWIFEG